VKHASASRSRATATVQAPLTWAFDGRFPSGLADLEDTLRRAIVQVGDVARVLVVIELSLPALKARMAAGDKVQPAWGEFLARVTSRYGLPAAPRLRYLTHDAPLLVMIIAYRS
jgi:hypothetical protein